MQSQQDNNMKKINKGTFVPLFGSDSLGAFVDDFLLDIYPVTNKQYLEAIIQQPVNLIAYPNGLFGRDYLTHHCDISKKLGFKYGLSTNDGGALVHTNSYQIPRFMPYRKQLPLFALSIAKIAGEHV